MIAAALLAASVSFAAQPSPRAFKWRGVLEGYFGRPWTWAQRERLVDWLARHHFNVYAIGPKEDPEIRARWREPLKDVTKTHLRALASRAKKRGVALAWTLSPGADARPGDEGDRQAAADKLSEVCALGIEKLTLGFDDAPAVPGQAAFANDVLKKVRARCPGVRLIFAPAQYWGAAAPSRYLDELARDLDPEIAVAWTGPAVLNRSISAADSERFRDYIRHDLILCDNYPVQDRLVDGGRLFLGPLTGREPRLSASNEGYLVNANPLLEASLIPLATAGDYAFEPGRYDPYASWKRALKEAAGAAPEPALEVLAGLCARSWLEPPPGTETERLERVTARYWLTGDARALRALLGEIASLPYALNKLPPALARELKPWLEASTSGARGALAALDGKKPADEPPAAVVGDQFFERFQSRARFSDPAGAEPLARELRRFLETGEGKAGVRVGLERLADLAPGDELDPWPWILSRYADAAADALDGHPWSGWRLWLLRWRCRLRLLPLMVSRRVLERFIVARENAWGLPGSDRKLTGLEKLGLNWVLLRPSSRSARLVQAAADYRGKGWERPIDRELVELIQTMRDARSRPSALEAEPWREKVVEYAQLSLAALQSQPPADWALRRESLASGNGLELALELKLALEAAARGEKFIRPMPADPADAL